MGCPDVTQRGGDGGFRVVEAEAAFFHYAAGLGVAVVVAAPDCRPAQRREAPLQQAAHGFRR